MTVEAVLWFPFFIMLLILIVDVSFAFHAKAQAYRIIEAGNRSRAVGNLTDAEVESWIRDAVDGLSPTVSVTTETAGGLVSSTVVMPAEEVMAFGWIAALTDFDITVRAQQYVEGS